MHDQVLVAQVGHTHPAAGREPVTLGQRDDVLLLPQRCDREVGVLGRVTERPHQGEVDRAVAESGDLVGRQHLALEREVHAGQLLAQRPREGREERVRRGADAPDDQPSLQSAADALGLVPGRVDGLEDRPDPDEVGLACGGQVDAAGGAGQQRHPQLTLELPDLLGQRRLGHVQPGAARPKCFSSATARK